MRATRRAGVAPPLLLGSLFALAQPTTVGRADDALLPAGPAPLAYRVSVRVDPDTRRYEGSLRLDAPGFGGPNEPPLPARWHLFLNAFAHDATTWMRTAAESRADLDAVLEDDDDPWGFLVLDEVRCGFAGAEPTTPVSHRFVDPVYPNPLDRTVVELDTAACASAAGAPTLGMEFHGRLPVPIARTGAVPGWMMLAQWLPKVAGVQGGRVIDHPFFGPTEFFANFADWDVTLDVPAGHAVVATGEPAPAPDAEEADRAVHRFRQRWVHDFAALVASDVAVVRELHTPSGRRAPVALQVVLPAALVAQADRLLRVTKAALDVLGSRVGAYPYDVITVLAPPFAAGRTVGMEYPTLLVGMFADPFWDRFPTFRAPELVVAHEFAHQYFYGIVATNELEEAWLDEGLTEYWTWEIVRSAYGAGHEGGELFGRAVDGDDLQAWRMGDGATAVPPASLPSFLVDPDDIGVHFYRRPSLALRSAARVFGQATVDAVFRRWFAERRFTHPRGEDFFATVGAAASPRVERFLRRAFEAPGPPVFAVQRLDAVRWQRPRGRFLGDGEPREATDDDGAEAGSAPAPARGVLELLRTAPGVVGPGQAVTPGVVESLRWPFVRAPGDPDEPLWRSTVRIATPDWPGWSTTARLRFANGAVARGRVGGSAPYEDLEIVRRAPLASVRLARVPADPDPADDGRLREPDAGFVADFAAWAAAGAQWLAAIGVTLWL